MNLALTYTMDALRHVEGDLQTLCEDEQRLQARKAMLEIRRASLIAQREFLRDQSIQ